MFSCLLNINCCVGATLFIYISGCTTLQFCDPIPCFCPMTLTRLFIFMEKVGHYHNMTPWYDIPDPFVTPLYRVSFPNNARDEVSLFNRVFGLQYPLSVVRRLSSVFPINRITERLRKFRRGWQEADTYNWCGFTNSIGLSRSCCALPFL